MHNVSQGAPLSVAKWCLQVAIKKVLQDRRFKNRELQIMRMLSHTNVVRLRHCFYSTTEKDEVYLNLVLDFVPETVYRIGKHYSKNGQRTPLLFVRLYVYQVCGTSKFWWAGIKGDSWPCDGGKRGKKVLHVQRRRRQCCLRLDIGSCAHLLINLGISVQLGKAELGSRSSTAVQCCLGHVYLWTVGATQCFLR